MNFPTNRNEILPWALSGWRLITLLVLVLAIVGLIFWAFSGDGGKGEKLKANEDIDAGKNAVISNLLANKEKEVNATVNEAQKANANLANAILRDSNTFSGNGDDAENAFCSRFCRDSSCAEWRQKHPEFNCPAR